MKAGFFTLGCKLNQAETESIAAAFRAAGYVACTPEEEASVYIVNTCTVTTKGEQKARRIIRKILNERPDAAVIVTGCYAQLDPEELSELGSRVAVIPLDRKDVLLDLPERLLDVRCGTSITDLLDELTADASSSGNDMGGRFRFEAVPDGFHTRPALKIQDGCDNRCSYCRVSVARGPSVSLEPDEVIRRIGRIEKAGKKEVVLTGVNISSYRSSGITLDTLLSRIVSETDGIRIRLSSLEPDAFSRAFVRVLEHPRVCPHFHLPVQSGSDSVLTAMRRRYRTSEIRNVVRELREIGRDPFLAADVIVGFPGETGNDFENTAALLTELDFAWLHVFPYSPRPGTAAFTMPGFVPEHVAGERAARLQKLSERGYASYLERQKGRTADVLLESVCRKNGVSYLQGRSENYLRTFIPADSLPGSVRGDLIRCRLTEVFHDAMTACPS